MQQARAYLSTEIHGLWLPPGAKAGRQTFLIFCQNSLGNPHFGRSHVTPGNPFTLLKGGDLQGVNCLPARLPSKEAKRNKEDLSSIQEDFQL